MSIPTQMVRVRFAPSPTGFLHIGGVRTALYNWLYARSKGGKFLLRIEDTDIERSEDRFTQDILQSMLWLGLNWDEEPLFQSKRMDQYRKVINQLIDNGHAYRCTCTEDDVGAMRERLMAEGKKPMYDRSCREKNILGSIEGETPFVVRLKIPLQGAITFNDLIRGPITVSHEELDDFVIMRSNGAPTYNLSVVVDDIESRITHIIRGDDHINNTPKQILLYQYLGAQLPFFAHLPMILGSDKKKLSKRNGVVSANAYRAEGYLPEALLNFLARIGWSHGDQEVFTVAELVQFFDFDHVQKASGVFNSEKLNWVNGEHIKKSSAQRIQAILSEDFVSEFSPQEIMLLKTAGIEKVISLMLPKVKLIKEMIDSLKPLCVSGVVAVETSTLKWNQNAEMKTLIQTSIDTLLEKLAQLVLQKTGKVLQPELQESLTEAFSVSHVDIDALLRDVSTSIGIKLGDYVQPLRLSVSGRMNSVSLFELIVLLPWSTVRARLENVKKL